MEITGIDRFLKLAREFGIDPARKPPRTVGERPGDTSRASSPGSEARDIRISLSAAARNIEKPGAPTSLPAIDAPIASSASEPIESNEARRGASKRTGGAIAAYQRNTPSPVGERFRVRA